jgi:glycosyltransferase involved in cell wall biosynthesis
MIRKMSVAKVTILSIIKNEAEYLPEWICFHLAAGFDHFILYNNSSDDGTREVLSPYIQEGVVTLIEWPKTSGQIPAYVHAIGMFGRSAEWFCVIDADEFVVLKQDQDVASYLSRFEASQIYLPWRVFGFSGHRTRPEGLVIDNFRVAERLVLKDGQKIHTKFFVRPLDVKVVGVHNCLMQRGDTVDWENNPAPAGDFPVYREFKSIQLNHYYYKSYEEFRTKIHRGSATGALMKKLVPYEALDRTFGDEDDSAQRFREKTLENMRFFRRLPARLFRYGRRFANRGQAIGQMPYMSDLSYFDPFRWFVIRALSNFVAGEQSIRIDPPPLPIKGLGNRFVLGSFTPANPFAKWVDNLHLKHLLELMTAECLIEVEAEAGTAEWVTQISREDRIYCYMIIVHVAFEPPSGGEVAVHAAHEQGELHHVLVTGEGESAVVCEINGAPKSLSAVRIRTSDGGSIRRVFLARYG